MPGVDSDYIRLHNEFIHRERWFKAWQRIACELLLRHAGEPRDCGFEEAEDWAGVIDGLARREKLGKPELTSENSNCPYPLNPDTLEGLWGPWLWDVLCTQSGRRPCLTRGQAYQVIEMFLTHLRCLPDYLDRDPKYLGRQEREERASKLEKEEAKP